MSLNGAAIRCFLSLRYPKQISLITLYEYMQQPRYWIARDDDGYWLVPARDGGWHERSPFVGRVVDLRELDDLDGIALWFSETSRGSEKS